MTTTIKRPQQRPTLNTLADAVKTGDVGVALSDLDQELVHGRGVMVTKVQAARAGRSDSKEAEEDGEREGEREGEGEGEGGTPGGPPG